MIPTDMPLGMDFLKQFWQQGAGQTAAAPSFATQPSPAFSQAMGQYMMPTFDLNELDKRMGDMRTVLQFMELNTQLLRQSLSTLEVQRNTLATLQSMASPTAPPAAPAAAQPQAHSQSHSQSQASDDANAAATSPWLAAWQSMVQATSQGAAAADRTDATAAPATVVPVKKTPAKKAATTVTAKVTTKTKAAASKTAASQKSPPAAPRKR